MGIINDWTITYTGFNKIYNIAINEFNKESILKYVNNYIKKYDFEYEIKSDTKSEDILENYLTWINNKFIYNRKTSLRNVYENCLNVIENKIDGFEFKKIIESYFSHDKNLKSIDEIIDNPDNIESWFNFFYEKDNRNRTFINSSEFRTEAVIRLNRVMESFNITPLNLLSGITRIFTNEYDSIDGKKRLESSFEKICKYSKFNQDFILNECFKIIKECSDSQKYLFCQTVLRVYNHDNKLLEILLEKIPNKDLELLWLKSITKKLRTINKNIDA